MATNNIAHPIGTLRELVTSLEAAITLTLAKPKTKPVHNLRTTTRRIEAQLELLSLLPDLPEHGKPAKKARKLLATLRRAAGRVRDLDVQRDLAQSKSPELHHEVEQLRSMFKRQRRRQANRLLNTIDKHQPRLTLSLEALLEALAPAEPLTLSASRLTQLTLHWYIHNTPATPEDSDQLHAVRKSAKLARYMAESSESTKKLSQTFEALQQSGGEWHDWLTLSEISHRELGASSPLTQSFAHHCKRSLADYQRHLKSLPKSLKA